jgi:hypothetical protein
MATVLALAYPLSFGPACWIVSRMNVGGKQLVEVLYYPLFWIRNNGPGGLAQAIDWYVEAGSASGWKIGEFIDYSTSPDGVYGTSWEKRVWHFTELPPDGEVFDVNPPAAIPDATAESN